LGFNIGHDRGVAVIRDGVLIGAIAQERIDRIKHSPSVVLPFDAIDAILSYLGISINEVSNFGVSSTAVHVDDLVGYVKDSLMGHYKLTNVLVVPISHHQAHAESTYFTSDFSEAIVLIADGGGEVVGIEEEAESIFFGKGDILKLMECRLQSHYFHAFNRPHNYLYPFMNKKLLREQISLGKKYGQISCLLGFGSTGAGKTMGLAAYGDNPIKIPPSKVTSPFSFNLEFQHILREYYTIYEESGENYFAFMEKHKVNIARTMQDYAESQVMEIVRYALEKHGVKQICLAGGLFLNCPINHKILEHFPGVSIHTFPAAGDDGQSIGTAIAAHRALNCTIDRNSAVLPYLGISYSNADIEKAIKARNLPYHYYEDNQMAALIASKIIENQVVALLRGRSEIGPRALCHRSILANPTDRGMKDRINAKVKYRESFRPFAPVVTSEDQFTYFNLLQDSPYMLLAASVKHEYKNILPSITHIDGSARPQAVKQEVEPFVHRILSEFKLLSGVPVILNTSFNENEPIVESPSDAIQTFLKTDIDVLVMENYIIYKNEINAQTSLS